MIIKDIFLVFLLTLFPLLGVADDTTVRVGVSLPLTGAWAEFGDAVRNGIELARRKNPASFAKIEFLYDDSTYDSKKALTSLHRFIDVDQVDLVFVWGNEPALAVSPVAEQRKVPTFAVAQYPQVSIGRTYVTRFINNGEEYSKTLLDYLRTKKIQNLGIVKSELSFFNMLVEGLLKNRDQEKIVVLDTFLPTETDFHSSIIKLKGKTNFDILGVYLTPPQVDIFFKQSKALNFHPRTFGATSFESKSVMSSAWREMNGAVYTHNAVTNEFRRAYIEEYGNDVQLAYAGNSYDFAMLTARLLSGKSERLTATQILNLFSSMKPTIGACGPFHFVSSVDTGNHFEFDIVVRQIKGDVTEEVFRNGLGAAPNE